MRTWVVLALLALAACRNSGQPLIKRVTPLPNGGAPEVHQKIDPKTGQVQHEWSTVAVGNESPRKQGKETILRKDGSKEWEREWERGKPAGLWRSWYANGQLRSELFYAGPIEERPMTFWFENGQRRMQGPAKDGVRCGHWKVWFADGKPAEEGNYVGSRREGEWQAWSEDGQRSFVRVYQHDVRIKEREGSVAPKDAPPLPDVQEKVK
jgi:antitoxin component YwqK of YwqJK toxin-antitoxin module